MRETIVRFTLGYDTGREAIAIPVADAEGNWHTAKFRRLDENGGRKKDGLARPALLYPLSVFQEDPPFVVLSEGELDALLLIQHGIPAVTSTASINGWTAHPEWADWFVGRRVAVLYDTGSFAQAEERAEVLRAAGVRSAWACELPFKKGEDITDWFVTHRRDVAALKALINAFRRREGFAR